MPCLDLHPKNAKLVGFGGVPLILLARGLLAAAHRGLAGSAAGDGDFVAQEQSIVGGMTGRYAVALYNLAHEGHSVEEAAANLARFSAMMRESADLRRLIKSPIFSGEQQVAALNQVLEKGGVSGLAANFIKLVASKRRLFAIEGMIADFGKLNDAAKGVTRAEVTAAQPLSERHLETLRQELASITGSKSIEVSVKVDPAIIGGLIVKLGSRMVDGSLKTKLNSIRTRMKEVG